MSFYAEDLLVELSHEIKTNVSWNFGGANYNKDLSDSEGSVSKTCVDNKVESRDLIFGPGEDFVVTAAKFCNDYLNGSIRKRQRIYIHVLDDDISHAKCNQVSGYIFIFMIIFF